MSMPVPSVKQYISERNGKKYRVAPSVRGNVAAVFAFYCEKVFELSLAVTTETAGIVFATASGMEREEYIIKAESGHVTVLSSDAAGANRGAAALLQLLSELDGDLLIADTYISDAPDNPWRGLMVDVARQWYPFETLLEYVDLCWLCRLETLHLHFADDQGYRLPSAAYPGLPSEKHYTEWQIRTLEQYAAARSIEIMPEIEFPGHAKYLTVGAPEAFGSYENPAHHHLVCMGNPALLSHFNRLLSEVCEWFPHATRIHFGGDEAFIEHWEQCEACRQAMAREKLDSVKAAYSYWICRAAECVLALGRTPVVWEGFPKEGSANIPRSTVVMVFESLYQTAPELIEGGFPVVNASWKPLYIVPELKTHPSLKWNEADVYEWDKTVWKNWVPSSKAYEKPIVVDGKERASIRGGEMCIWDCKPEEGWSMLVERVVAFAEKCWNDKTKLPYREFFESGACLRAFIETCAQKSKDHKENSN